MLVAITLFCAFGQEPTKEVPKEVVPTLTQEERRAVVSDAYQAMRTYLRSERRKESPDDIDPALWGETITALKPIRVRNDRVNVAVVFSDKDGVEEGLYVSIPISSYAATVGDRFTLLTRLSIPEDRSFGGLYHYRLRKPALDIRAADGKVLIGADEIASYDWATHTLILKPGVADRFRKAFADAKSLAMPFALAIGGKTVYEGEITTGLSSRSSSKVVILVDGPSARREPDRLRLQLGYPTDQAFQGKDPRGDERVKQAFQVAGKAN